MCPTKLDRERLRGVLPFVDVRHEMLTYLHDLKAACTKWEGAKTKSGKKAIGEVCAKMRPLFFTLSPDLREGRENFVLFDGLCSSPILNLEVIIALTVKLIGPEVVTEHYQKLRQPVSQAIRSQPSHHGGKLPVPNGLGAALAESMRIRGHGQAEACAHIDGMDPKTLRKLLNERESVQRKTLKRAEKYVHGSTDPSRRFPEIPKIP